MVTTLSRRTLAAALACAAVALAAAPAASAKRSRAAPANDNGAYLLVLANNVENLLTTTRAPGLAPDCYGDYRQLATRLSTIGWAPDIFLVQQISNTEQANTLKQHLTNTYGHSYSYIIAQDDPERGNFPCGGRDGFKGQQTNAIYYRTARFNEPGKPPRELTIPSGRWMGADVKRTESKTIFQSWGDDVPNGFCSSYNLQARSWNVGTQLYDQRAGKWVTVISAHWPAGSGPGDAGHDCAWDNARSTERFGSSSGGALQIVGGDMNVPTSKVNVDPVSGQRNSWWYQFTLNGWKDSASDRCLDPVNGCGTWWTIGKEGVGGNRIDFIFARVADGVYPPTNKMDSFPSPITLGSPPYSEHRAVASAVYYP